MEDYFANTQDCKALDKIIKETGESMEGNCIYLHKKNFIFAENRVILRNNLFKLAKYCNNILEIGFNAGHSNMIFLQINPNLEILNFDICSHKYTKKCHDYLSKKYNTKLIEGDSLKTIPDYLVTKTYSLIHIDGGHGEINAFHDVVNCKKFATKDTLLVVDDTNFPQISGILMYLMRMDFIKEAKYRQYDLNVTPLHKIFQYC